MDIQNLIDSTLQQLIVFVQQWLPNVQPQHIRYAIAGMLVFCALILLAAAFRMLRNGSRSTSPAQQGNIPKALQQEGTVIDLLNSTMDDDVAVRFVVTSVSSNKIKGEIIERLDVIKAKPGHEVICIFAPVKTDEGKVNSFTAKLLQSDVSGGKIDRIVLSAPQSFGMAPRRKHARKRVADQQFIRVKLWVDNPYSSDIAHEDAAPHIGVDSFSANGTDQSSNAVVNISNGGLALSVLNQVIPETCGVGAHVAINLFMFNFREKTFKPYWYSGQVRSMEEGTPGFTRLGMEFNGTGQLCDETGKVRWQKF